MMVWFLTLTGSIIFVAVGLLLLRADRALNEARDIRHELLEDRRRADDAQLRALNAIRHLEGLSEAVDRSRSRVDTAMAAAAQILRTEHDKALQRDRR